MSLDQQYKSLKATTDKMVYMWDEISNLFDRIPGILKEAEDRYTADDFCPCCGAERVKDEARCRQCGYDFIRDDSIASVNDVEEG